MLNYLTGISKRHNRALRDVRDWAATVQRFLTRYDLYGSPNFDSLFKDINEAKLDLTTIAYRARTLIKTGNDVKGQKISPLMVSLVTNVENLRRALINPSLHETRLGEDILSLLMSFEKLQETLSDVEYR
jgi:hypothetical protein